MAYSLTARAVDLLFLSHSAKHAGEHLLGRRDYTIGGLLPNNGRLLQSRVPEVAGLTDDVLIDGSAYHCMAPLLSERERYELRESMFEENARGCRGMIRRPGRRGVPLQYCLLCALRDARARRPQIWRVVPNFPGVNCCHEHGCLLVTTEALLEPDSIHAPGKWIDLEVPLPPRACTADRKFAEDVAWIYGRKSADLPGYQRLGAVLRKMLLRNPRYVEAREKLSAQKIAIDLGDRMQATVIRLDPALLRSRGESVLNKDTRYSLARYSLLAQLAASTLEEVFELAMAEAEIPEDRGGTNPRVERLERVALAQLRLVELVAKNPRAGRKQIIAMDESTADVLRRNDPGAYEAVMPARIRRGRNSSFDWPARDQEIHGKISDMVDTLGEDARSSASILARCGLSKKLFEKARGRLPWASMLVSSIVESWHRKREKQTCFSFL